MDKYNDIYLPAIEEALEQTDNINSRIANILRVANTTDESINNLENKNLNLKKLLEDSIAIYTYLRDTFHVQTVTEARVYIEDRKIDPKIIELWIEEGMFGIDMFLSTAVNIGYPELSAELKNKELEIRGGTKRANVSV